MIEQMSSRERTLAGLVAGVAFIFLNIFVIDYFSKNQGRLRADFARNAGALAAMKLQLAEKPMWDQRDAWLEATQPKLTTSEDVAGGQLLQMVLDAAKRHQVQVVTQSLRLPAYQPEYCSISVEMETSSTWSSLIGFMRELQGPDKFIVFESADLKIDDKDATKMRGNFKVAKWYAPKQKPK